MGAELVRRRRRRRSGCGSRGARRRGATLRPARLSAPSRPPLRARSWPAFRSAARSSSRSSSNAPSSSPVRKSRFTALDTTGMEITVLCWNIFHGRDFPPDPELRSWRSRLLRLNESNDDPRPGQPRPHAGVRRRCSPPPPGTSRCCRSARRASPGRWRARAAPSTTGSSPRATSSASGAAALARQNPDLMASGEGGSNTTLVRVPGKLGGIAERRELEIHAGEPERRSMAFTRTASGVCVCQPARDQRPAGAGGGRRAAGRRSGDRVGGGRAADLRRRPQPAAGRGPGALRAARRGLRARLAGDRPAGDRPRPRPRPQSRRGAGASGRPRSASCPSTARPCDSPITLRSRPVSPDRTRRCSQIEIFDAWVAVELGNGD